jgi:hypothetical protein
MDASDANDGAGADGTVAGDAGADGAVAGDAGADGAIARDAGADGTIADAGDAGADSAIADAGDAGADAGPVVGAKSCSAPDVQSALMSAPDGAVVTIPAGTCDWGGASVSRPAGVWLKGAGKGQTILQRTAPVTTEGNFMLEFDCANGAAPVEVSDLALVGNDDLQTDAQRLQDQDNGLSLKNGCVDFRVHDAAFSKFSTAGVTVTGNGRGVIYQSDFVSNFKCQPTPTDCLGYGVVVYGDPKQPPPLALGTEDAVFVEDSYFYDNRHGIASNEGSRYVFRHNRLVATARTRNFGLVDAHGRGAYPPGSRSWEIYENTLETDPGTTSADGIAIRGGDGVIFDNTIAAAIPYAARFTDESGCTGVTYPAPDQIREAYVWDNDGGGPVVVEPDACADFIKQDRDYFLKPRPGYTPFAYPHPLR